MRIEGSANFKASPEQVFAAFSDKDALARATPGLQSMDEVAPDKYEATLKVGVAGITGTYKGRLELQNKQPPKQYTLVLQGDGGPGFVRGTADFSFEADNGGTTVNYVWDVQVGGKVAGVGQRVLGGVGKLLIGQFMKAMSKEVGA